MLWLWVLAAVAAALFLLSRLRLGARAAFGPEAVTVRVTVGPLRVQVYPARTPKKEKPPKAADEKKAAKGKTGKGRFGLADLKSAWRALAPAFKKALSRTRRGVKVHPLDLSVTLGGSRDPAAAATLYGELHGAVWAAMPAIEQLLYIPDPHLHIGLDFDREDTQIVGEAGLSLRLGTLLAVGLGVAIPALRWFMSRPKETKKQPPEEPSAETAGTPAA